MIFIKKRFFLHQHDFIHNSCVVPPFSFLLNTKKLVMKTCNHGFMLVLFLSMSIISTLNAQEVLDRAENTAKRKTNRKIDQSIDKGIDAGFDAVGGLFKKKKKKSEEDYEDLPSDAPMEVDEDVYEKSENQNNAEADNDPTGVDRIPAPGSNASSDSEIMVWTNKYDFIPGSTILFYDDFTGEEVGEFPSRWDLISGQAENVKYGENEVVNFLGNNSKSITPLFDGDFELPEKFTIELDVFFRKGAYYDRYQIDLAPAGTVYFNRDDVSWHSTSDKYPNGRLDKGTWHHISISFNKRSLKVYMDENRILNIPNVKEPPKSVAIGGNYGGENRELMVDNIRIAEGAKELYEREFSDGKMVTNNIHFETNKADLLPRSYAEIQRIAEIMKKYPGARFRIEGHTDSDGTDAYNQELSMARADAVRKALAGMGINSSDLTSEGFGESKPIADNNTPEGKAQNRRVEFVKL